jgi:hypothetical protein
MGTWNTTGANAVTVAWAWTSPPDEPPGLAAVGAVVTPPGLPPLAGAVALPLPAGLTG